MPLVAPIDAKLATPANRLATWQQRHMSFKFYVYDIEWPNALGLPDETTVSLSDELVGSTDIEEDEWQDAVNGQLQRQFGERALSFQMTGEND